MSWEVLTRTECDGFVNTWTVTQHGQEPRPEIFATREDAERALSEFLAEAAIAAAVGDLADAPDPADYTIAKAFPYELHRIEWNGIGIEVRYAPEWLALHDTDYDVAHVEIEAVAPRRAPLPITETGYRSHFTSKAVIDSYGGAVAFARAWIQAEEGKSEWQAFAQSRRQMTLF